MIYTILASACFTQLIVNSTPSNLIKMKLDLLYKSEKQSIYKQYLTELINCALCTGFWFGFILGFITLGLCLNAFFIACISSVLSELIKRQLDQIKF